jgi:predicted glycoside hydrolase/deacetylase ChbG (UPF0249 family)
LATAEKFLIVNADDFGLTNGVNRGIAELYQLGLVTSTSMMVNMPGFENAVKRARRMTRLGVGLHFNLTYGAPLSPPAEVPTLVNAQGQFSGEHEYWTEGEVVKELGAQLVRLLEAGIFPTHLDTHQFVQVYEAVYRPIVYLANFLQLPLRRVGDEPQIELPQPRRADRYFLDTYFNRGGKELLLRNLASVQPGVSELMCHPGYVGSTLRKISQWTDVRETELRILKSPEVLAAIRRHGIRLINYSQMRKR